MCQGLVWQKIDLPNQVIFFTKIRFAGPWCIRCIHEQKKPYSLINISTTKIPENTENLIDFSIHYLQIYTRHTNYTFKYIHDIPTMLSNIYTTYQIYLQIHIKTSYQLCVIVRFRKQSKNVSILNQIFTKKMLVCSSGK